MAEFVKVMKEYRRMCNEFSCSKCPLFIKNSRNEYNCSVLIADNPEEYEKIVMEWAEKNPEKTILMDFKEKYPNAPYRSDGIPKGVSPYDLGYEKYENRPCKYGKYDCFVCWNRPLSSLEGEKEND